MCSAHIHSLGLHTICRSSIRSDVTRSSAAVWSWTRLSKCRSCSAAEAGPSASRGTQCASPGTAAPPLLRDSVESVITSCAWDAEPPASSSRDAESAVSFPARCWASPLSCGHLCALHPSEGDALSLGASVLAGDTGSPKMFSSFSTLSETPESEQMEETSATILSASPLGMPVATLSSTKTAASWKGILPLADSPRLTMSPSGAWMLCRNAREALEGATHVRAREGGRGKKALKV